LRSFDSEAMPIAIRFGSHGSKLNHISIPFLPEFDIKSFLSVKQFLAETDTDIGRTTVIIRKNME